MCNTSCKVCDNLIVSTGVTVSGTNLVINIPTGTYRNDCTYCIVVAQSIPATATIYMPVVVTIGTSTTQYPLVDRCCDAVTACGIRTRRKYKVKVNTTATGGSFRVLSGLACRPSNALTALPVSTTGTTASAKSESESTHSAYDYN